MPTEPAIPTAPAARREAWQRLAEAHALRNRREKRVSMIELVLGGVAFGLCLYTAALPGLDLIARLAWVALAMLAAGFSVWAWRSRRRHWTQTTPAPTELMALEEQRLTHRLRYWRLTAWIVCGLWVGLGAIAILAAMQQTGSGSGVDLDRLFLAPVLLLPVLLVTVIIAYQVRQGTAAQLRRLRELTREGEDND